MMMRRMVVTAAVVLAVVSAVLALWQMHEAVLLLLLALAFASALDPTIRGLSRRGLRRNWAIALTFGVVLVGLVLAGLLFGLLAYTEVVSIITDVPAWYDTARNGLAGQSGWRGELGSLLPPSGDLIESLARRRIDELGQLAFGLTTGALTWVVLLLSTASLGFYWLLDQQRFERLWLSLLPLQLRVPVRSIWTQIFAEVGIYLRGVAVIVLLSITALASVYSMLAMPGAMLLAIGGGLAQVIPLLGPPIALFPAMLVALAQGPRTAVAALVLAVVVLGIIKGVIAPRVFRYGINVNPVLVILLIMALAEIGGLALIVLAPPLAAAIQASLRIVASEQRGANQRSQESEYRALREQLDALEREHVPGHEQEPQIQVLVARARDLIDRACAQAPDEQESPQQQILDLERAIER